MMPLHALQQDQAALTEILNARRAITVDTLPRGAQLAWGIYLTILEDALKILHTLIHYLGKK